MASIDYADDVDEELTMAQRTDLMNMMGPGTEAWVTSLGQEPDGADPYLSVTFYYNRGRAWFTNTSTNTWDIHGVSESPSYKLPDGVDAGLSVDMFYRE